MGFSTILHLLLSEGRMPLEGAEFPGADDRREAEMVLGEFEERYRLDCPGQAPMLSLPAAIWAAEMFYAAAVAMTYREIDAAGVDEMLSQPFPEARDASAHYSVDVTFRLLPELYARAKATSRSDPLLSHIETWAKDWPLSSVGIPGIIPERIDDILADECLRVLYIDRVIARQDRSRLEHPEVQAAVRAACGIHHHLAPEIHAALTAISKQANPE